MSMVGALDPQWFAQSTDGELSCVAAEDESPDQAEIGPTPNTLIDMALGQAGKTAAPGFHRVLRQLTRGMAETARILVPFGITRPTAQDMDPPAENREDERHRPSPEVFP
jgi:hypothetical protein|nr:hypothetical protein [Methylococcus capsulatus]